MAVPARRRNSILTGIRCRSPDEIERRARPYLRRRAKTCPTRVRPTRGQKQKSPEISNVSNGVRSKHLTFAVAKRQSAATHFFKICLGSASFCRRLDTRVKRLRTALSPVPSVARKPWPVIAFAGLPDIPKAAPPPLACATVASALDKQGKDRQ